MKISLPVALVVTSAPLAFASPASNGLLDPDLQPKFQTILPNPLDPSFIYSHGETSRENPFVVSVGEGITTTGLVGTNGVTLLETPIWGYGADSVHTWPGKTFEVQKDEMLYVHWKNEIPIDKGFLITGKNNGNLGAFSGRSVVDTSCKFT